MLDEENLRLVSLKIEIRLRFRTFFAAKRRIGENVIKLPGCLRK